MDKNILKSFAIDSRRKMIESVKYQASLIGITADGIDEPISNAEGMETYDYGPGTHTIYDDDINKRESLVNEIQNKGFDNVVEEVAYTWFNRIIAIRYMEINDYLPTRTRVLSSELEGKTEPDIITESLDLDLDYDDEDKEKIFRLNDENKLDELFQFLFVKQCNKLNDILPGLFEKTDDWMELLLNISFTDEDGVVRQLVTIIPEEDFGNQVEIIGWLYQFYIFERKTFVNNALKSKPIQKEDIPAATQLFTPNWIVKYMVDNSLGRYWIERNNNSNLKNSLSYYLEEPAQVDEVELICKQLRSNNIKLEELKFLDPCMGSGHILVYAFDVFFEIYRELGYLEKDIPELILKNNLYGLDIDTRAYQISYFALLMKGREIDRNLFNKNISPLVYNIKDSNLSEKTLNYISNFDEELGAISSYLNNVFKNATEFGSLIQLKKLDFAYIESKLNELLIQNKYTILDFEILNEIGNNLIPLINQAKLLSLKYEIVVTNPPYLNKFNKNFKEFSKQFYKDYSRDLFSMFIYRNLNFCKEEGYAAFMTPMVWMYIKNFEKLRKFIIDNKSIVSLIEMEYHVLWQIGAYVPACIFVLSNQNYDSLYKGSFLNLTEFTGGLEVQNKKVLEAVNHNDENLFIISPSQFNNISRSPIAYWADENVFKSFKEGKKLNEISDVKGGLATADNKRFLRLWHEINFNDINFNSISPESAKNSKFKWFPCNKGGKYRKWYGNHDFIINWENDGEEIRNFKKSMVKNTQYYFKKNISWSTVTSGDTSFRFFPEGFVLDHAAGAVFIDDKYLSFILGFLNSNVPKYLLKFLSPTMNNEVGHISLLPVIESNEFFNIITPIVNENITISKNDWDDYEVSWNFKIHPLLKFNESLIENAFRKWRDFKETQFNKLKNNEFKLNTIFSEIYSITLECGVEDKYVSVNKSDYEMDIKSFISYAVGCMFGRYSLDNEGLIFAGEEFDISKYSKFIPDDDNIIPVLDTAYFDDDIVGRFEEFIKICFGEGTVEENLNFIAAALNKKGNTSREIIRNYFLTDFFKDHAQTYKKYPIYWQFDSGRQNGFKCLVYMHRYEPGLVARVRTDYLHKTQKAIEQNITHCDSIINNSSNKSEISKAKKDKTKHMKQLDEIKSYDEALGHIANQQIEIDLDDGVKVNYSKFQNVEVSVEGEKVKKINLLKKI